MFAFFPAIHKNKFPQIKIMANIFLVKIYSGVNLAWISSDYFDSLLLPR